jgi:hypothetical protein
LRSADILVRFGAREPGADKEGYPLLKLSGMLSSNFVVQYSTNLAGTNWTDLLSLSNLPFSPYLFLDPDSGDEPARFYRAFMR